MNVQSVRPSCRIEWGSEIIHVCEIPRCFLPLQELPKRISTDEEREILSLLCKVHELEIEKVEMQSEAVLKEHEVKRRDLLILKYDKQRTLCDEIIQRQRKLIEGE